VLSTSRPILDAVDVVGPVDSTGAIIAAADDFEELVDCAVVDFAGPANSDGPLRDAVDLDDLVDSDGPVLDAVDFLLSAAADGPLLDTVDFLVPVDSDGPLLDAVDFLLSAAADGPLRGGPNETPKPRLLNLSHSFDKNSDSSALRSVRRTG
jgi:hypothetical protein